MYKHYTFIFMRKKVVDLVKNNPYLVVLALIVIFGVFLRVWNFSDWLHFELDQARDARVIDLAYKEGVENLPLLGPKAGGTFLRLGPFFYYFSYASALIFGNTPSGIAFLVAIVGILAIPMFFLFSRLYFSNKISLAITFLFSSSVFLVIYSRFSWNPNMLPFFMLLSFYALFKATNSSSSKKHWWLYLAFFSLGATTQLHFLVCLTLPIIFFFYLIFTRPKFKIYHWLISFLLVVVLYIPPIINDIKTGGDNISQLLEVAQEKAEKDDHNVLEKIVKNYMEHSVGSFIMVSGLEQIETPRIYIRKDRLDMICDDDCKENIHMGLIAVIFFSIGLLLAARFFFREKDKEKKNFLVLLFLWIIIVFGAYTPLAYRISPRFFLAIAPIPFIFLGFAMKAWNRQNWQRLVMYLLIFLLVGINLVAIRQRFWQLSHAHSEAFYIPPDRILKEKTRVTLLQQNMIIEEILKIYKKNKFPIYINSDPQYRRSFLYHLEQKNILRDDFRNASNNKKIYEEGNYFLIYKKLADNTKEMDAYQKDFEIIYQKQFGTLVLYQLKPKSEAITDVRQEFNFSGKTESAPGVPVRYKWEQIFNESSGDESDN